MSLKGDAIRAQQEDDRDLVDYWRSRGIERSPHCPVCGRYSRMTGSLFDPTSYLTIVSVECSQHGHQVVTL